jgi:hypothetical protein
MIDWFCSTLYICKNNLHFNFPGSVHHEPMSITVQQDATMYSLLYFCKLLYMFWVVAPPIIRSTYNCNYSIWHWSDFGKCSVWSQLKMSGMYPSLIPSATAEGIRDGYIPLIGRAVFVVGPFGPTTNTARLSLWYEGKTRGCHCSHWAPDDGREKPETCWAVNKLQDNKLKYCCIRLVIWSN